MESVSPVTPEAELTLETAEDAAANLAAAQPSVESFQVRSIEPAQEMQDESEIAAQPASPLSDVEDSSGQSEWNDEQAAAEEAALAAEIQKRSAERATDSAPQLEEPETKGMKKRGFFGRIFKRKGKEPALDYLTDSDEEMPLEAPEPVMEPAVADKSEFDGLQDSEIESPAEEGVETRLAEVEVAAGDDSSDGSPIVISRRLQVPITLGPEEIMRGAKLRLELEIKIQASETARSKVA
jgi:hypothetical protein